MSDEEFIIIYVLDRIGEGAETYLYAPADVTDDGEIKAPPVLLRQLNPGDILIREDQLFKHGAAPLINPVGGTARRDALVCTVGYHDTWRISDAVVRALIVSCLWPGSTIVVTIALSDARACCEASIPLCRPNACEAGFVDR